MKYWRHLAFVVPWMCVGLHAQTLYVPSGTSGIGSSSNGNVGIGTSLPQYRLELAGDGAVGIKMRTTNELTDWGLFLRQNADLSTTIASPGRDMTIGIGWDRTLTLGAAQHNQYGGKVVIPGGNVGIGTTAPEYKLDVAGEIRTTSNLVEKKLVFTPTAVGWYRILSGGGQAGGTIRTNGGYDNATTKVEFIFSIRGYGQGGALTLVKPSGLNGSIIDQARISTDGGGNVYLDVHILNATNATPIAIYGYGPDMPGFVANPVVGATAGSTNVRTLPLGPNMSAFDDFRTTGNIITYSNDGSSPQGYIYHGSAGQAAFGNGVVNGETWITRTGGAGTIKLGDSDLNTAIVTIGGTSNSVGIGTANLTHKLNVNGTIRAKEVIVESNWADYVFAPDYRLAPLAEVEQHIKEKQHLPGIPSAAEVAAQGVSIGEMQSRLLAKIEEMTLHQIALEKRVAAQEARLSSQSERIATLESENRQLRGP